MFITVGCIFLQLAQTFAPDMWFWSRCLVLTLLEPLLPSEPTRASKTVGPLVGASAGCQLPQAVRDALTSDPACTPNVTYIQQVGAASNIEFSQISIRNSIMSRILLCAMLCVRS